MSRIPAVTREASGLIGKVMFRVARKRYGAMLDPMAVMMNHRGIVMAGAVHEMMVEKSARTLPASVRELAVYRAAVQLGCEWCIDFGTMLQRLDGLDIDRLKHIDDHATSPLYSAQERLAIAYADAMTATPVTVTDEQVAELTEAFGEKGVVELTYLIALENMRARMNSALGIAGQGFSDACAVPLRDPAA